jgi:hypothetical protein
MKEKGVYNGFYNLNMIALAIQEVIFVGKSVQNLFKKILSYFFSSPHFQLTSKPNFYSESLKLGVLTSFV